MNQLGEFVDPWLNIWLNPDKMAGKIYKKMKETVFENKEVKVTAVKNALKIRKNKNT